MESLVAQLEPMCGIALALNLAYLNLDVFRYRDSIRKYARKRLSKKIGSKPAENFSSHEWYQDVSHIADSGKYPCTTSSVSNYLTGRVWFKFYQKWFEKHSDEKRAILCCGISALILVLGVVDSIGWPYSIGHALIGDKFETLFINPGQLLVAPLLFAALYCLLFPVWIVKKGRENVTSAKEFIKYQLDEGVSGARDTARGTVRDQRVDLEAATNAAAGNVIEDSSKPTAKPKAK